VLVGDPLDRDSTSTGSLGTRTVVGCRRWRVHQQQELQPLRGVAAALESEGLETVGALADSLGNANHLNVYNNGQTPPGLQGQPAGILFGSGTDHLRKFGDAGVIALLFGAGARGSRTYHNDTYIDGQLFMKSRAGAFLNGGGLARGADSH